MYITLLTIVRVLGVVLIVAGIVFAVWPVTMKRMVAFIIQGNRLYAVAAIRITMGIILLLAAGGQARRFILATLGVIILLAGISQLIMSLEKQRSIANWMTGRPEVVQRLFGIAALLFGVLMFTGTFLD
jgi:uncharacterized membrane protein HdeD (DUF308 family)